MFRPPAGRKHRWGSVSQGAHTGVKGGASPPDESTTPRRARRHPAKASSRSRESGSQTRRSTARHASARATRAADPRHRDCPRPGNKRQGCSGGTVRALATRLCTLHAREVHIGAVRAHGRQGGDGLMVDMAVLVLMRVDVIGKKVTLVDDFSYKVVKNASGRKSMLLCGRK